MKAGWSVGCTLGFPLASGLTDSPLGNLLFADPNKTLETAPSEQPSPDVPRSLNVE